LDCDRRFDEKSLLKKHCSLKGHTFLKEEPSSSASSISTIETGKADKKPENEKREEEAKMKRIFKCDEDGCGFKSKFLIALKKHKCTRYSFYALKIHNIVLTNFLEFQQKITFSLEKILKPKKPPKPKKTKYFQMKL